MCAYQEVRNISYPENFRKSAFKYHKIWPSCLVRLMKEAMNNKVQEHYSRGVFMTLSNTSYDGAFFKNNS